MKNAKTILFASLIAAMILPFSMMGDAKANSSNMTCEELIAEDSAKKTDKINKKTMKKIAKNTDKFKQLNTNSTLDDTGIVFEGEADFEKCTMNIKTITQTFEFEKNNKPKKLSVTIDPENFSVKHTSEKEKKKIHFSDLGTVSSNWAGYAVRDANDVYHIDQTLMYWDVPEAKDPSSINCGTGSSECHITVWTGLTDTNDGSDVLSQLGTDSSCIGNDCTSNEYFAWIQFWDDGNYEGGGECDETPISAGDSMYANMKYRNSNGTDQYYGLLMNLESGKTCSMDRDETEKPIWGQWQVERPVHPTSQNNFNLAEFSDFDLTGYFYDNDVLKGLDDLDTSSYDYHDFVIDSTDDPFVDVDTPDSDDKITINYIKSS